MQSSRGVSMVVGSLSCQISILVQSVDCIASIDTGTYKHTPFIIILKKPP